MQPSHLLHVMQCSHDLLTAAVAGGIQVDGKLGDACWSSATNSDAFLDIKGPDGPTPWFTTQVKMLWDDAYLYVAAQLEEPRAFAHNTLHDR